MKKEYIKPIIEMIELNVVGVMATSNIEVNEDEYTGPSFSKKKFWDTKE